jgi:hypothetical protein
MPWSDRHGLIAIVGDVLGTGVRLNMPVPAARETRTDFDLPLLRVNTDAGYDPGLESIVDFVTSQPQSPE